MEKQKVGGGKLYSFQLVTICSKANFWVLPFNFCLRTHPHNMHQTAKLSPHAQLLLAFGLLK